MANLKEFLQGSAVELVAEPGDDPERIERLNREFREMRADTNAFGVAQGIQIGLDHGVPASYIIEFYGGLEELERIAGSNITQVLINEELKEE